MQDHNRLTQKRLKGLSLLVVIIALIMIWRMFDIQIVKHSHYLAMAQDQQRFEKVEIAQRGKVYVHDSYSDPKKLYPMAFDVKQFAVWVVPHNVKNKDGLADKLSSLLSTPKSEIFDKINNDKLYIPPIKKGLTLDDADKVKSAQLPGVLVVPEYGRYYPEGTLASQVIGFVNAEGNGNYGFEGHYNTELKGLAGTVTGEQDTLGRVINLLDQKKPQDGTSYVLTIDRSTQYFVEKKLTEALEKYQADSGSVVVMDTQTGGIVAMASAPTYDPNNFKEQAKVDAGRFVNPVIAHLYEPGSIFKPIVMAAALDAGTVTPNTTEVFGASVDVDGFTIHTAEDQAFGEENPAKILENSDNVAMVWISEKMGKEKMNEYIDNFGFYDKTRIDLDSEASGYAKPVKQWRNIDRATISFGQGINVTPMELVAAYAAIANKGVYVYPHIVDKILLPDGSEQKVSKEEGKRVIKESTANDLTQMLIQAVDKGHAWRAGVQGFYVAAKTGTAQIAGPNGYEKNDTGLGIYNHSLAGYAPADNPRFAMIVKLERPKSTKYAESTAGELFGEIASYLLNYYYRETPNR